MQQAMPPAHQNKQFRCEQCRWFYFGPDGRTCRDTRRVVQQTQACVEFTPYQASPFEKVMKDKIVVGLQQKVQAPTEEYLKKITAELKSYRITDKPKGRADSIDFATEEEMNRLANKFDLVTSYTDRVVGIEDELSEKYNELNALMKEVQGYIFSNYRELIQSLKNDSERGAFYKAVLPVLINALDGIESAQKRAAAIHQNLKDTHFSLCQIQENALKVWDYRLQVLSGQLRSHGKTSG